MNTEQRKGIFLEIEYHRIMPSDETGMVNITCAGDQSWMYADVGSHHGAQCESEDQEKGIMEFGKKLSALVKKHFGAVTPLLER